MKLYLVRHGEAEQEQLDPRQPLSRQGRDGAGAMARFIKTLNVGVSEIFHSTKLRAKETAVIIQAAALPEAKLVERTGLNPNDNVGDIVNELQGRRDDLMIVSHLPFLPCLVSSLTVTRQRPFLTMPPAAMAVLESKEGQGWSLTGFVTTDMIKTMGLI